MVLATAASATLAVPHARATPIEAPPTQREPDPSQTPVIPSTFPEETDGGPSTGVKSSPVKPKSPEKPAVAAQMPDVEPAGTSTVRKVSHPAYDQSAHLCVLVPH
jgi:hypothetical protein